MGATKRAFLFLFTSNHGILRRPRQLTIGCTLFLLLALPGGTSFKVTIGPFSAFSLKSRRKFHPYQVFSSKQANVQQTSSTSITAQIFISNEKKNFLACKTRQIFNQMQSRHSEITQTNFFQIKSSNHQCNHQARTLIFGSFPEQVY